MPDQYFILLSVILEMKQIQKNFNQIRIENLCNAVKYKHKLLFYRTHVTRMNRQSSIEQYEYKISLLDEYALSLERQNQAKNVETKIIYEELNSLRQENQFLKANIQELRFSLKKKEKKKNINCSLQTSVNLDFIKKQVSHCEANVEFASRMDSECQTTDQDESDQIFLLDQVLELNDKLKIKEKENSKLQAEGEEMFQAIQKLEKDLSEFRAKLKTSEMANENYCESNRSLVCENQSLQNQLEQLNYSLYNTASMSEDEKNCMLSELKKNRLDVERLLKDNNMLIEVNRKLEKEKNTYYLEIRSLKNSGLENMDLNTFKNSRISRKEETENKSNIKKKEINKERWSMMEEKIQQLKHENKKIQEDLSLKL